MPRLPSRFAGTPAKQPEGALVSQSDNRTTRHPVADALREAGFVPLPRLWVRKEDIPAIHEMAGKYSQEVNDIRARLGCNPSKRTGDPKVDREAAWEAAKLIQGSNRAAALSYGGDDAGGGGASAGCGRS